MVMLYYIICTFIGLFFSFILYILAGIGGSQSIFIFALSLLFVFYLIVIVYLLVRSTEGRDFLSGGLLALPPFLVFFVLLIISPFYSDHVKRKQGMQQNYSEFKEQCRDTGVQYYKLPTKPVHSIAHYKDVNHSPFFEFYETDNNGKLVRRLGNQELYEYKRTLPDQIEFTECTFEFGGYLLRKPNQYGKSNFRIDKWSADIMIEYQDIQIRKAVFFKTDIYKHYLTIKDRRNGEVLARLSYLIDKKNDLACGFTGDNEIDEKYFVLKAIGLEK